MRGRVQLVGGYLTLLVEVVVVEGRGWLLAMSLGRAWVIAMLPVRRALEDGNGERR
jgi:hypothetical protein